jgi:hypothetical protein
MVMKKRSLPIIVMCIIMKLALLTVNKPVYGHGKEKHGPKVQKGDITFSEDIKPLFEKKCSKCHGAKSPVHMEFIKDVKKYKKEMKGPRMDTYSHLVSFVIWPDTGSLMRALDDGQNTADGKPGKMHKHLGKLKEERQKNLRIFKEWVGNWTLKEWANITKEEIDRMKLSY